MSTESVFTLVAAVAIVVLVVWVIGAAEAACSLALGLAAARWMP